MIEIKYRFWDTINQEMSDIALMIDGDGIIYEWDLYSMDSDGWDLYSMDIDETNRYIPMRYTGLKDKNGKEIYEGDIVYSELGEHSGKVVFGRGRFYLDFFDTNIIMTFMYENRHKLRVMGNIYQNPDLLKE